MFFKLLWGKVHGVKRLNVIQDHFNGGLGMIDIESLFISFKASWLHGIIKADSENDNWVQIPTCILSKLGGLDTISEFCFTECSHMTELKSLPIFYKDVVTSYSRAFMKDAESFRNTILDQPLWGNRFINVQKRGKKNVMLLRNWIRSGVRYIKDLSFVNGIVDRRVCNAIVDKLNIHTEYSCIRKALLPYANDIIRARNQNSNTTYEPKVLKVKSKPYYKEFICN